jgi:hypothetical protein
MAEGKIHQFLADQHTEGRAVRYKNGFITQRRFHFFSNFSDNINYPPELGEYLRKLDAICEILPDEFKKITS